MPNTEKSSTSSDDESKVEVDQEEETYVDHRTCSKYLAHLAEHIKHIGSHLAGYERDLRPLPSLFKPNSHWNTAEKESFFHGLTVHSRFRPDLIAEEVQTKTVTEICAYMDMLDDALVESQYRHPSSTGNSRATSRGEFSPAIEMSDEWISYEEHLAQAATDAETRMVIEAVEKGREQEIHSKRNSMRAKRGTAKCDDHTRNRQGEKERKVQFQVWLNQKKAEWEVRDFLDTLDGTMLRAMDMLIREDEEAQALSEPNHTSSESTLPRHVAEHLTLEDDELVDHSLCASSTIAVTTPSTPRPLGSSPAARFHRSPEVDDDVRPFANATPGRLPDADHTPAASSRTSSSVDGSRSSTEPPLSPRGHRRYLKRMYMRRRRAVANGGVVDEAPQRLRPGRKPKEKPTKSGHDDDMQVDHEEKPTRHPRASGITLPYKIRNKLSVMGIDIGWLQHEGLDFFHLGHFSRLMRTYNDLHDEAPDVGSHISADFTRLLLAHVVYFTTQVVRRAIIAREQEIATKAHTKAWRLGGNKITPANVSHALSALGVETVDKKTYFAHLLRELDDSESINEDEEGSDEDSMNTDQDSIVSTEANGDEVQSTVERDAAPDPLSTLPVHRRVYPPLVRLPKSVMHPHRASSLQSASGYIPWANDLPLGDTDQDDDLLAEETDEEALDTELREEEDLDKQDIKAAASLEKDLWNMLGPQSVIALGKRKRALDDEESEIDEELEARYEGDYSALRFRKPGGRIKSAVFVEDSDDELSTA